VSVVVAILVGAAVAQPVVLTANAVDDCAEVFAQRSETRGLQSLQSKGWRLFGPQNPQAPFVLNHPDLPHLNVWLAEPESAAAKESGSIGGYCVVYSALLSNSDVWEIDQLLESKHKNGAVTVGRDITPDYQPFNMRVTISPLKGAN
jgi:hypothetical protein